MRTSPIVLTLLAFGCASEPKRLPQSVFDLGGPLQEERTAVPLNINASFLGPETDVDSFVARWELESREVYIAREDIVHALELERGETVADVGAGTGLFASLLSTAVGPEGKVLAVDIAPKFVEHVRKRVEAEGLVNVDARLSTEHSAELPTRAVDVVLLCNVYHHFEYHEDMLRSIGSALHPGGTLVVVDFERIPGVSRDWLLGHVRANKETVAAEVEAAGFERIDDPRIDGLEENYCMRFRRP